MTPGLLSSPCCPQPQAGCELNQLFGTAFSTRGAWFGYILIYVHPWDRMRNSNKHLRKHSIYTGWFIQILNKWSSYPTESDIMDSEDALSLTAISWEYLRYTSRQYGMPNKIRISSYIYIYHIWNICIIHVYSSAGNTWSMPIPSNDFQHFGNVLFQTLTCI